MEWRACTTPYSFSGIISQFHENIYLLTHLLVIRRLISFLEDGRYNKATIKKATRASIPGNTENAPLRYRAQGSPQGLENKIKWSMGSVTVENSWRVTGLQSRTMLKWTSHGISVYFDNKLFNNFKLKDKQSWIGQNTDHVSIHGWKMSIVNETFIQLAHTHET